jgi:hypothetical protein
MRSRTAAVVAGGLLLPALVFFGALGARQVGSIGDEPARTAQQIVAWYAGHVEVGLWLLLMACPLTALLIGGVTLLAPVDGRRPGLPQLGARLRGDVTARLVLTTTCAAGAILAVVALHALAN